MDLALRGRRNRGRGAREGRKAIPLIFSRLLRSPSPITPATQANITSLVEYCRRFVVVRLSSAVCVVFFKHLVLYYYKVHRSTVCVALATSTYAADSLNLQSPEQISVRSDAKSVAALSFPAQAVIVGFLCCRKFDIPM